MRLVHAFVACATVPIVMGSYGGEYGRDGSDGEDFDGIFECDDYSDREECRHKKNLRPLALLKGDFKAFIVKIQERERSRPSRPDHKFDFTCAEACFRTPGCRFDPESQGSYCKTGNHPNVCFGLYHVPRSGHSGYHRDRLCYEPSNRKCPEQFPVLCGHRHHKKHEDKFDGEEEYRD